MLLRFTKNAPTAKADLLTCVREGSAEITVELPRAGVLPVGAIRCIVETTLGWRDGWLAELATATKGTRSRRPSHVALQSEVVARCLQAEQWGGAASPDALVKRIGEECRASAAGELTLTEADVAKVRTALREFGAGWRPLPPGGSLERTFDLSSR